VRSAQCSSTSRSNRSIEAFVIAALCASPEHAGYRDVRPCTRRALVITWCLGPERPNHLHATRRIPGCGNTAHSSIRDCQEQPRQARVSPAEVQLLFPSAHPCSDLDNRSRPCPLDYPLSCTLTLFPHVQLRRVVAILQNLIKRLKIRDDFLQARPQRGPLVSIR
jgi:hypothetical protein